MTSAHYSPTKLSTFQHEFGKRVVYIYIKQPAEERVSLRHPPPITALAECPLPHTTQCTRVIYCRLV